MFCYRKLHFYENTANNQKKKSTSTYERTKSNYTQAQK